MASAAFIPFSNEAGIPNKTSNPQKQSNLHTFNVPAEKRRRTNPEFLVIFAIIITAWFALSFYCIINGDLNRFNIPEGKGNASSSEVVSEGEVFHDEISCITEIWISCAVAIGLSTLLIALFRYYAGIVTWLILGATILGLTIVTAIYWYLWMQDKNSHSKNHSSKTAGSHLSSAIFMTIITVIATLIIYAVRKSIKFTIIIFTESGKVVQTIPSIMLQPLVTLTAIIVSVCIAVWFALYIESSGFPTKDLHTGNTTYEKDGIMKFARVYNIFAILWILHFLINCQYMVIGGAVVTWFFSRDKSQIKGALSKSYTNLFKFHLGSVVLGSLVIFIVKILRAFYKLIAKRGNVGSLVKCVCGILCRWMDTFISFLTKNAYVEMAIYGDNLWQSGKRAFHVVTNNVTKVSTINSIGDWVMSVGILMVTACSIFVGYLLLMNKSDVDEIYSPLIFIGLFAFTVSKTFMAVFETIVDSVFICFCEDCYINDGVERPYFMSKEFEIFIDNE